jgi:hypothetical protein
MLLVIRRQNSGELFFRILLLRNIFDFVIRLQKRNFNRFDFGNFRYRIRQA